MGRIRTIKPDLFLHEDLADLEAETKLPVRLAFIGLFTQADKAGRFRWAPRRLKATLMPYDKIDFGKVLEALESGGFVLHYADDAGEYGCIPSWDEHQRPNHREVESKLPPLGGVGTRELPFPGVPGHAPGEGKGREGKGKSTARVKDASVSVAFQTWWESWRAHPAHSNGAGPGTRGEARQEWRKHVDENAELAMVRDAARNYLESCAATQTKTKHACRWLKKGWREYCNAKPQQHKAPMASARDALAERHEMAQADAPEPAKPEEVKAMVAGLAGKLGFSSKQG